MDRLNHSTTQRGRPVSSINAAKATDAFEHFISAGTLKTILFNYQNLCEFLHLKPNVFPLFYPKLKSNLNSWKAKALWKKFDSRVSHKCYARGKACPNTRVLIIGAGPCGLRTAIEAQLLGAKVVVIEKRDRMSRNNVLHLWPFVIEDLRNLGAKKFFGKFCAGAIDHISIRQLQCILFKVALLLGVEIHTEVSFEKLIEPSSEKIGWRAEFKPADHPVAQYEFDVVIGADGKRNTLQGFKRKEFRGKLAIAITANFINKRTEAEARVEEISGVAFIFNQKFFKELNATTGIDLENIVYYKDDTHYFVMTAKKHSLIDKGVIMHDFADTARLLSPDNVDREALLSYAREAADFSTNYQMPDLEFAVNHYGQPDVAMFDFTSMYAAENASKFVERNGYKLLTILVGDSLLEPFWPTGSGCARGFLSALDASWAIKAWGSGLVTPLEVLAERESIYRLLAQTTPENLNKDCKSYALDPSTRYPNLNKALLLPQQVLSLYDTDDPSGIELTSRTPLPASNSVEHRKRRRRDIHLDENTLLSWIQDQVKDYTDLNVEDLTTSLRDGRVLCAIIHHYRPDLLDYSAINAEEVVKNNQLAFDILEKEISISPVMTAEDMANSEVPDYLTMFSYLTQIYESFRGEIPHVKHLKLDLSESKEQVVQEKEIKAIRVYSNESTSAVINRNSNSLRSKRHMDNNMSASINQSLTSERKNKKRKSKYEAGMDRENRLPNQGKGAGGSGGADEEFAARIKDLEDKWREPYPSAEKKPKGLMRAIGKIETSDWNIKEIEKKILENKLGKSVNKEKERVPKWNREQFLARQTKLEKLDRQNSAEAKYSELDKGIKRLEQKLKEGSVRDLGQNKVATITEKLVPKAVEPEIKAVPKTTVKPNVILPTPNVSEYCHFCQKRVYLMERLSAEGRFFHRGCFKCQYCHVVLRLGSYLFDREGLYGYKFYCSQHFGMVGEIENKTDKKLEKRKENEKPLEKLKIVPLTGFDGVDLLNRVQTPERIEFANLSAGHISSDHDESLSQMDEDEWTDRNFGASTGEICSSEDEDESSSLSGSESDNEDAFEEALEEPPTKEGTLRWMERYKQRYSKQHARDDDSESDDYSSSSDHSSYYENSTGDDEDGPVTEDEQEIRARELRKQEVRVEPPVIQTDTGSETEIVSDETTSSSSKHNSATEISTDSEFAVDDPTPTREIPSITFNDYNVTKTRGNYGPPKRVQVKSGILQTPINGKSRNSGIKLEFTPLVASPILSKPAPISLLTRTDGYALNRTQSTGGIATKVSLELKKKYLLGDTGIAGNIQKSGSVSALDSKFKSFHTNITDCQKLLKPSLDITPTPQTAYNKSPLSPVVSQSLPLSDQSSRSHDAISPNVQSVRQIEITPIVDLTLSPDQSNAQPQEGNQQPTSQPQDQDTFKHELEGRPRSPVKEIPIVVPTIDWSQVPKHKDTGISSDSLTSDTESEEHSEIHQLTSNVSSNNVPRVQVHNDTGEILHSWDNNIPLDSLNPVISNAEKEDVALDDSLKSIINDKKVLNQPKILPELQKLHLHKVDQNFIESGHSTPSDLDSFMDPTNAALTETELSDWARDGMVSDDFEDVEFELNPRLVNSRKNKQPKSIPKSITKCVSKAKMEEFDDVKHVCGKEKQKGSLAENLNNLLSSLEFMDTGEETSSDEKVLVEANLKNNGYVEFQNEDEIIEDSLNPCINAIIETVNPEISIRKRIDFDDLSSCDKNTGYCIIGNDDYSFGGHVLDLKKDDLQKLKEKQITCDNEEDSLLILETGTTTEENTFSDSTVKNLIETGENDKKDTCNVMSMVNETTKLPDNIKEECELVVEKDIINEDYQEHCHRLQSKVEFGNAKDSIDIRKSKRKEKLDFPLKPDLIQEEGPNSPNNIIESLDDVLLVTPKIIYTKEQVQKVRDENQRLVQEMVMNKMKAQNRSLERKKRNRNSFSPNRSFDLKKSATTDITTAILNNENDNKRISTYSTTSSVYSSPDIITPLKSIEQKQILNISELNKNNENRFDNGNRDIYSSHVSSIKQHPKSFAKQLSVHSSFQVKSTNNRSLCSDMLKTNSEASSLPDIQQALQDEFKTPTAPPRHKTFDIQKSTEKLKQDARARVRLKSNEDLGLSPEEKLKKLREKINRRGKENDQVDVHIQDSIESLVINTDKRNSLLYSNDTLKKKRNNSFHRSKSGENVLHSKTVNSVNMNSKELYPIRTKSVSELPNSLTVADESLHSKEEIKRKLQFCKSDPNLLTDNYGSPDMKTKKGGIERRKSISKFISDLFGKKREHVKLSGGLTSKGFLSRISPKAKSKSMSNLSGNNADKAKEEITRTNSMSRISTQYRQVENASPPPIPPLPLNYTGSGLNHFNDDSTDGENDWKRQERSSCDTLDKSDVHRRSGKGSRRGSRQAQLKRHRMAQEIQRKLEETEVKTRELEQRGVIVEKALRGEISDAQTSKEECDLLKQWFELMRELTELRRYEKELTVRADELELEDRHTRLQQQLRERLDNDGHKTKTDVKVESNIISEMMDIVAKRDSLITVLEQDRIRYSEEDRDFEEQMLAKGLRLTPLQKSSNK